MISRPILAPYFATEPPWFQMEKPPVRGCLQFPAAWLRGAGGPEPGPAAPPAAPLGGLAAPGGAGPAGGKPTLGALRGKEILMGHL